MVPQASPPSRARSSKSSNDSASSSTRGSNPSHRARASAYRLRTGHRPIVHDIHRSVSLCGIGAIPGGTGTATLFCDDDEGAYVGGLLSCKSAWACPACSSKLAAARAEALGPQVTSKIADGWSAYLLTLTVQHHAGHHLGHMFDALGLAWGGVTSGGAWKRWRDFRGLKAQYTRGLDLTYSDDHGWHPHLHVMLLLPPGGEQDDADWMMDRWRSELAKLGWQALPQAQDCRRAQNPEAAAAYAVTPASVYESVAMAKKRARGRGHGLTPFEILEHAVNAYRHDRDMSSVWISLWRDYVKSTKGRRQVTTSRGLTLRPDDELDLSAPDDLASMGRDTVRELDRRELTAGLLDVVENAPPLMRRVLVTTYLSHLAATDWQITSVEQAARRRDLNAVPCSTAARARDEVPRPDACSSADERSVGQDEDRSTRSHAQAASLAAEHGEDARTGTLTVASTAAPSSSFRRSDDFYMHRSLRRYLERRAAEDLKSQLRPFSADVARRSGPPALNGRSWDFDTRGSQGCA